MKKYNDIKEFENDLIDILADMLIIEIRTMLEFLIDTHNIKPLKEIIEIINKNKY